MKGLVLAMLGGFLLLVPSGAEYAIGSPLETVLWVVSISVAHQLMIPMLPRMQVEATVAGPVIIAAAVVLPPSYAALVTGLAFISTHEFRRTTSVWLAAYNRLQDALGAALASLAAVLVHAYIPVESLPAQLVLGTVAATVAYNVTNGLAVAVALWGTGRATLGSAARDASVPYPRFAVDYVLVLLLALLLVLAYQQVGPWATLLLAMPLWLGFRALSSARESEDRAEELAIRVRELETLNKLGTELVQARRPSQVEATTARALSEALDTDAVAVSLVGDLPDGVVVAGIPGAEPAAIGVPRDLSARSSAVVEAVAGLVGMALQRLELEEELAENEKARARLSERILEEGNQERSRIALYIHDDVLPYLAAAEIQADNVRTAIRGNDTARADTLTVAVHEAVHDGIARLRQVLDELRDQILTPGGLQAELQALLDDLDLRSGVHGKLTAPESLPSLPLAVEILVLETVRGCLANVAAHAGAAHAEIRVEISGTLLRVTVEDDGKGFDPGAVGSGHHGLVLMTQRVELARGRLMCDSAPGQGTRVHLEVPV